MGIPGIIRPLLLAGMLLGMGMPAAASECPAAAPAAAPARAMTLHQLLDLPNRPDAAVEGSPVVTIGYLVRVRKGPPPPGSCAKAGPVFRLWLATRVPYGLKGLASRHRAVVATLPVASRPGGLHALEKLVGRRIRVSGGMTFNAGGRGEMMRTRGSLWELRDLSLVAACPAPSCSLAPPPTAQPKPARH